MFFQKIRAIFEWFAQKRAAKDREVLDTYQWTTYRSPQSDTPNSDQEAVPQPEPTPVKKRGRPAKKGTSASTKTGSVQEEVSSESSEIEPRVEIDVDALFDGDKPATPQKKTRVAKTAKATPRKRTPKKAEESATKTPAKRVTQSRAKKAEEKQPEGTPETKPVSAEKAVEQEAATKKPAVRKPRTTKSTTSAEKTAAASKKTTVTKRTVKPAEKAVAPKTKTQGGTAGEYREISRGRDLKELQAALKEKYPQVEGFTRKFEMTTFLRQNPEAVGELKAKLNIATE